MVEEGLRSGALRPGKTLLDATSGNTGIAYAMIGASAGFPVRLCVPSNVTIERKRLLHAYGAEMIFTDPMDGSDGAIREARRQVAADPDRYFYPDQYNNDANWRAHYQTTGPEILAQTEGRITHFVAGLGTSGTFMGDGPAAARGEPVDQADFLPARLAAARPRRTEAHGDGHRARAFTIRALADEDMRVSTEDAYTMVRRLAREEGLLVGISGGAALAAALKVATAAAQRRDRDRLSRTAPTNTCPSDSGSAPA